MIARNIPESIKRQVRQECGFGCVICGMPIFHYDHIAGFATVQEHSVANLALLCPIHHQHKTSGRMSEETVRRARRNPFNQGSSMTAPAELVSGEEIEVRLGSNIAYDTRAYSDFHVLFINGAGFFTIHHETSGVSLTLRVTDEEGNVLLAVDRGQLSVATEAWDYRFEGTRLSVRCASGDIVLDADLTDRLVQIHRGHFVDQFSTGCHVTREGALVFTVSGMEIGRVESGRIGHHPAGAFAFSRASCFDPTQIPGGYGFGRVWAAEYEQKAEALRRDALAGKPGPRPPGLERFRPMPLPASPGQN